MAFVHGCCDVRALFDDWRDRARDAGIAAYAVHSTAFGEHVHFVVHDFQRDEICYRVPLEECYSIGSMLDYIKNDETCIEFYLSHNPCECDTDKCFFFFLTIDF